MALFNIYLENDNPDPKKREANKLPEGWADEFAVRSKKPTSLDDLQKRTRADNVKKTFIKDNAAKDFETSFVLSKKILDVLMAHPDFHGIRVYLGIKNEPSKTDKPRNCFVVVPVDDELKNITAPARYKTAKSTEQLTESVERSSSDSGVAYYTEDPTCCPPRIGCQDSNSFS